LAVAGPGSGSGVPVFTQIKDKLTDTIRDQEDHYAGGQERPLRGYAITLTVYAGLVSGLAALAKATGRDIPDRMPVQDIGLSAVATHKLSRLLARDPVTSPLRAPFTSYQGSAGPAELNEDVRGRGARKTIGELVTCPFCTSVWVATVFTAGTIYLPRTTRLAMGTLTALAGSDLLQFAHAWVQRATD
jgi:hypothetical protein